MPKGKDVNEQTINELKYLARTYDGVNKLIVSTKNRLQATQPRYTTEDVSKHNHIKTLESLKGNIKTQMKNALKYWDIWNQWLSKVPGIGEFIASNLILLYYYRFIPVCEKCGGDLVKKAVKDDKGKQKETKQGNPQNVFVCSKCKTKAKGGGILEHRIEHKEFPCISAWHSYLGEANDLETGRQPRPQSGVQSNWSSKGRKISWQIGESFVKVSENHPYKQYCNKRQKKRADTHPNTPKWMVRKMINRETRKFFLSHFWSVARQIEGLPDKTCYAEGILGHENIIPPYYWPTAG